MEKLCPNAAMLNAIRKANAATGSAVATPYTSGRMMGERTLAPMS
jgi:hypothetical protein